MFVSSPNFQNRRILIVDDNRDAADSLAMLLCIDGYEVDVAYDGGEALKHAQSFRPRLVVLDLNMPVLSGFEVARVLKGDARRMFLLALSADGTVGAKSAARDAGFDLHLTKPADPTELRALMRRLLGSPVPPVGGVFNADPDAQ